MFSLSDTVRKTVELLRSGEVELAKATFGNPTTATGGIQLWNLDEAVKTLVPKYTPLRNSIPRVGGQFARQANWKAVTAIDSANGPIGVPDGTRNADIAVTVDEYNAVFKTLAVEASATFQSEWAAKGLESTQGIARKAGVHKYMVGEESVILGGNTTGTGIALGVPATPTGALVAGGSMTAQANRCYVVALTHDGWKASSVAGGVATTTSVTPADGSAAYTVNRGSSNKSAESAAVTTASSNLSVRWSVTAIRGAVAYAWFVGLTGAGNCLLAGITATNSFLQTADATGTQAASAITADKSQDQYVFDGLITQISKSGSNGYWRSLDNATLTATGKGGIVEFDTLLVDRFVNYKCSSYEIIMSANQSKAASDAMRTGATATPLSINVISDSQGNLRGGSRFTEYTHPITGEVLPLIVHTDLPDGTIIFKLKDVGALYDEDRVPNVWQMAMRQDMFSIEWPARTLRYELAVIADGVLQGYFPAGNGIIANVALPS